MEPILKRFVLPQRDVVETPDKILVDVTYSKATKNKDASIEKDIDSLADTFEVLNINTNSKKLPIVTNVALDVFEYEHSDGRKIQYVRPNYQFLDALGIPEKRYKQDIEAVNVMLKLMTSNTAVKQLKEIRENIRNMWLNNPVCDFQIVTSPIVTLFQTDIQFLRIYDSTFNQFEVLNLISNIVELIIVSGTTAKKPLLQNYTGDATKNLAVILNTFKTYFINLNDWFKVEIEKLKATFPNLDAMFWDNIKENDWSQAVPHTRFSTEMSWNQIKIHVLPKFHQLTTIFTMNYLALIEAKILNSLQWINYFPSAIAKNRKYTEVWPNIWPSTNVWEWKQNIPKIWHPFFTCRSDETPLELQRLFWNGEISNLKNIVGETKANLTAKIDNSMFDDMWQFSSIVNGRISSFGHLSTLMDTLKYNNYKAFDDERQTWAGIFKEPLVRERFMKLVNTQQFENLDEEFYRSLCAELQVFIHPLMYQ